MSPVGRSARHELHGEQLYAARREKEFKQQQFDRQVSVLHRQAARRAWEDRSDLKRVDASGRARTLQQSGCRDDMLYARRCKLREKLEREEAALEAELTQPVQTADQRREEMRRQLAELRGARERERREFAEKMYDYQWRLGCDELRAAVSYQHAQEVRRDRDAQLAEQRALRAEEASQEALHQQILEEDVRAFHREAAAHVNDAKQAERMRMEVLNKQQQARQSAAVREREENAREAAELSERLAKMRVEEEEDARRRREQDRRCRAEMLADMAERRRVAEEERRRDLEAEREICARDNEDCARETAAEAERRVAHARGMDAYLTYLRQARLDEQRAEQEVEQLVQQEAEAVYQRQREEWLAERRRRQCLLQETIDIRRGQVEARLRRAREERAQDRAYHEQLARELERLQQLEEERLERLREAEREHAADLRAQSEYRRRQEQERVEEERRLAAACAQQEQEYQERLERCLREKLCDRPHPWRAEHKAL
ncbi:Cilia- and flagella-associated protein 53 [Amphibalanus amphitrite]|uniref:Cilia- and flagella-associated protein 53 n=1 Tax=Amphibalanus amphitrite TaxID=1232801 RepID=A0A6A4X668_AMPAM|nr:Cilia- and flagella-associated protein 53 [Amphibalanus amphitrite]